MTPARDRFPEMDSLRGLAALAVVFFHVAVTFQLAGSPARHVLDALPFHPMFSGRLAVIFFFVLSGMVLSQSLIGGGLSYGRFAARRIVRLCLPVAAALALSSALYWMVWDGVWPGSSLFGGWRLPPDPIGFARQTMLIGADGDFTLDAVLWSLVHELRLSLLLPFVVACPAFRGAQGSGTLICVGMIVFGLSVAGDTAIEDTIQLGPTLAGTIRATGYFALPFLTGAAITLGEWHRWRPGQAERRIALGAALCLLCSDNDLAMTVASVLLISLARHDGAYRSFLLWPAAGLLGRISYSLYLVHLPVQLALQHGLHRVMTQDWLEPLTIAASLCTAWVFYHVVERPVLRLSRRIGAGSRPAMLAAETA